MSKTEMIINFVKTSKYFYIMSSSDDESLNVDVFYYEFKKENGQWFIREACYYELSQIEAIAIKQSDFNEWEEIDEDDVIDWLTDSYGGYFDVTTEADLLEDFERMQIKPYAEES